MEQKKITHFFKNIFQQDNLTLKLWFAITELIKFLSNGLVKISYLFDGPWNEGNLMEEN